MPFLDQTSFNVRIRTQPPKKDVDTSDTADDGYIFYQPFRTLLDPAGAPLRSLYQAKVARILQQAAANRAAI